MISSDQWLQLKQKVEDRITSNISFNVELCFYQLCTSLSFTDVYCSIIKLIFDHYSECSPLLREFARFYIETHDYIPRDINFNFKPSFIQALGYELLKQYTKYPCKTYKLDNDAPDSTSDCDYKSIFENFISTNVCTDYNLNKIIQKDITIEDLGILTVATLINKHNSIHFTTITVKDKADLLVKHLLSTIKCVPKVSLDIYQESVETLIIMLCDIYKL
jgi:hypothetical protein